MTSPQASRTDRRGLLRGGLVIAVATGVMNLATYGYTVAAAHLLGPESFGAFSAVMGVLLVVNVVSLGLQATAARRIAADPDHAAAIERVVLAAGYRGAPVLAGGCLLLAPLLDRLLRLDSLATALLVGLAAAPLTVTGAQAGVLQGERRWWPLAGVYLASGLGRVLVGLTLMAWWRTELAAVLGVAVGAYLPVLVGALALRGRRSPVARPPAPRAGPGLIREVAHSCQALLAFFALSNADILLARRVLEADQAGLYAAGLVLVKAVVFLPQFVVVVSFPSMSRRGATGRPLAAALGLVAVAGMGVVLGTLLLPDLAVAFVGGGAYHPIGAELWLFALVGTVLAGVQVLLYSVLARRQQRAVPTVWAALVVLVVAGSQATDVGSLVRVVALVDGALLLVLLSAAVVSHRRTRRRGARRSG